MECAIHELTKSEGVLRQWIQTIHDLDSQSSIAMKQKSAPTRATHRTAPKAVQITTRARSRAQAPTIEMI
ncbi:hypothetical protein CCR75_005163 [Bremia lactucae]|uniref:Uncharacterized protein n=1 Tax=Bremia lactucae TaxID=4779 RepID=A0A976FGG3_BRELC|nr:hypothetical protein CCR75_005163 [Bremia lactucae]